MSKFKPISSPAELNNFVNSYIQNRNLLKSKLQESNIGQQVLEKDIEMVSKPITQKIDEAIKHIPQPLQSMPQSVMNKVYAELTNKGAYDIDTLAKAIQPHYAQLDQGDKDFYDKLVSIPKPIRKEFAGSKATELVSSPLFSILQTNHQHIPALDTQRPSYDSTSDKWNLLGASFPSSEVLAGNYTANNQNFSFNADQQLVLFGNKNVALDVLNSITLPQQNQLREFYIEILTGTPTDVKHRAIIKALQIKPPRRNAPSQSQTPSQARMPTRSSTQTQPTTPPPPSGVGGTGTDDDPLDFYSPSPTNNPRRPARTQGGRGVSKKKLAPFGDLHIDLDELKKLHLKAYNGNRLVYNVKVDVDFFDLMTKSFRKTKNYSKQSIQRFNKLFELSNIDPNDLGTRKLLLNRDADEDEFQGSGNVRYYKSPEQLLKRFNQIVGSITSGNSSKRLYNEATNILDALRADKVINKAEYSKLYKKYLAI